MQSRLRAQLRYLFPESKPFQQVLRTRKRRVILSTGYGVLAEKEVSLRLASYLLPGVYLAKWLSEHENEVKLRIYFAQQGASIVLGPQVDINAVQNWVEQATQNLDWFMRFFAPGVVYDIDTDQEWEGTLSNKIEQLASVDWPPVIRDRVKAYPYPRQSFRYLAAHALYMLDPLSGIYEPILRNDHEPAEGCLVVVIGGPQERFTAEVRSYLRHKLGVHNRWQNLQLETPIGRLPVYCPTKPDLYFSDLSHLRGEEIWEKRKEFEPDAFSDLQYLAAHCFGDVFEERKVKEVFVLGLEELQSALVWGRN